MQRWLRILLLISCVVAGLAAIVLLIVYRATQQVPEFYREALAAEPEVQQKNSDRMLQRATTLHNSVKRAGAWQGEFTAAEVNGWLATDLPRNFAGLLPPAMRDPRVRIAPDGITLACLIERGGLHCVVSLEVDVYLDAPNVLAFRLRKARAGAVPWPLGQVLEGASEAARHSDLRVRWQQAKGDPVALVTLPPVAGGGGRTIRIEKIQLEDGVIRVAGTTERAK